VSRYQVVYIGHPQTIANLLHLLERFGMANQSKDSIPMVEISALLARTIARRTKRNSLQYLKSRVYFASDLLTLVRYLPQIDASLILLDERSQVQYHSPKAPTVETPQNTSKSEEVLQKQTQNPSPVSSFPIYYEDFISFLKRYSPDEFYFPTRRVCVVLAQGPQVTKRIFELGLANVRGCIVDPQDPSELFFDAIDKLALFAEAQKKSSLCVSGGGLDGYLYSVGVINALNQVFTNKSVNDFDIYAGVSSGALAVAPLAMGVNATHLWNQLDGQSSVLESFTIKDIFDFGLADKFQPLFRLTRKLTKFHWENTISELQSLVPLGFFKGDKMRLYFERQLKRIGIQDNIATLKKELYVSATDQDTGEHVVFGEDPWRNIKISQAVRASSALPPFFLPEKINGHWFTDGQLTSSSDFNTAIKKGASLVIYVDPMVAYTSILPGELQNHGGFFATLQAVKSLVQTRSRSMLRHTMDRNPDVDFVVFRPTDDVMKSMAGNPMHLRLRTELTQLGYCGTLTQILAQYQPLRQRFQKHGWELKSKESLRGLLSKSMP
jgi:NTE family protein